MSTDAADLPELTERQEKILAMIVREYTSRPEPVGSKFVAGNYLDTISSATIRNDMARLEELGLLAAPHTSAGRVPTEAGYRYFVKRLLADHERELPADEKQLIAQQFSEAPRDLESWMRVAAVTLSRTAHGAALVTPPRAVTSQFKHLALIATHGRMVMMVLVLYGGDVRQQMLTLTESVSQEQLGAIANHLNALCEGLTPEQIRSRSRTLDNELEREILEVVADTLEEADTAQHLFAYLDGMSDVLTEFTEREGAQQALRVMEERTALHSILAEALNYNIGKVAVIVAGDNRWDEVRHLGLVLSRYGVRDQAVGSLVVLGPTRMRYGRAISAVGYVAALMSNLMIRAYGAEPDDQE